MGTNLQRNSGDGQGIISDFVSRTGNVIKQMARKSLLMHEVVVDADRVGDVDEGKSAPRDQLRFLKDEILETKKAVHNLDEAVKKALSFREKSSRLLEEAHRALSRLEQSIDSRSVKELIDVACEIKVSARRGLTLVDVYGGMGTLGKMATIVIRKQIYHKFDKVIDYLKSLLAGDPVNLASSLSPGPSTTEPSRVTKALSRGSTQHPAFVGPGSVSGGATSSGAPPLAPAASQGPYQGTEIRSKHDKVTCVAFVPYVVRNQPAAIWWSSGGLLEYWANEATTAFNVDKPTTAAVTALGVDWNENVWTGHMKGGVRVRPKNSWDYVTDDRAFSTNVKVIAFDEQGQAWIGDEAGMVKVWRLAGEELAGSTHGVMQLVATCTRISVPRTGRAAGGPARSRRNSQLGLEPSEDAAAAAAALIAAAASATAAAADATASPGNSGGAGGAAAAAAHHPAPGWLASRLFGGGGADAVNVSTTSKKRPTPTPNSMDGAVRSIHVAGPHAWVSAGRSEGRITVWSTTTFTDLDSWDCSTFGHCNAMKAIGWGSGPNSIRRTNSPGVLMGGGGRPAAGGLGLAGADSGETGSEINVFSQASATWRLLTGHENGQLLMWHPDSSRLSPLISIGDTGSPVRGIAVFEEYGLVLTGHHSGELVVFLRPGAGAGGLAGADLAMGNPGMGAGADSSRHPNSFGMYRPKKFAIRAHKSALSILQGHGLTAATVSVLGTIRLWAAKDMVVEAERHGLMVPGYDRHHSGLHTSHSSGEVSRSSNPQPQPRMRSVGLQDQHHTASSPSISDQQGSRGGSDHPGSSAALPPHLHPNTPNTSRGPGHHRTSSAGTIDGYGQFYPTMVVGGSAGVPSSAGSGVHGPVHGSGMMAGGSFLVQQSSGSDSQSQRLPHMAGQGLDQGGYQHQHSAQLSKIPAAFVGTCQTIDYSELSLKKLIGSGAYGKVWLAEWTGCQVAVKELIGFASGDDAGRAWQEMQNEVHLLGSLSHPNIMRFMAISLDPPTIVMQYYAHGSLFSLLQRANRGDQRALRELTWTKRLEMLRDVAAGMHYLHTRRPPVIHGDLRSPNLLLDLTIDDNRPRYHVKIADFGLARIMHQNSNLVMLSKTTNPRWTAPEVIRDSAIGTAGDVYSFAIIMWEMLTWQQPFEEMMSVQVIFSSVAQDARPDMPPDADLPGHPGRTLREYKSLMERCWSPQSAARPSFKQVVDEFQSLRDLEAQDQPTRQARNSSGLKKASSGSAPPGKALPEQFNGSGGGTAAGTPSSSAGSTKSEAAATAAMLASRQQQGGAGASAAVPVAGAGGGGSAGGAAPAGSGAHSQYLLFGMSPISEENSLPESSSNPTGFAAAAGGSAAGSFVMAGQHRQSGSGAVSASPFGAPQQQQRQSGSGAASASPFGAPQQQRQSGSGAASASPFGAPQQQRQSGSGAASASPFGAPQQQQRQSASGAASASPFGAPQQQQRQSGSGAASASTSPFGAPQQQQQLKGRSSSPFAAAQQQQPASSSSPFAAASHAQQPAGTPSASPFAAASSPFAAASGSPQQQPRQAASSSPFAAAQQQPGPSSSSPFASQQQQQLPGSVSSSPFAAAQPQTGGSPSSNSPFAQPTQQHLSASSPFAAAQPAQQQQHRASLSAFAQQHAAGGAAGQVASLSATQAQAHAQARAQRGGSSFAAAQAATQELSRGSSNASSTIEHGVRDSPVGPSHHHAAAASSYHQPAQHHAGPSPSSAHTHHQPGHYAAPTASSSQQQQQQHHHGHCPPPHPSPAGGSGHPPLHPSSAAALSAIARRGSVASSATWSDASMDPAASPPASPPGSQPHSQHTSAHGPASAAAGSRSPASRNSGGGPGTTAAASPTSAAHHQPGRMSSPSRAAAAAGAPVARTAGSRASGSGGSAAAAAGSGAASSSLRPAIAPVAGRELLHSSSVGPARGSPLRSPAPPHSPPLLRSQRSSTSAAAAAAALAAHNAATGQGSGSPHQPPRRTPSQLGLSSSSSRAGSASASAQSPHSPHPPGVHSPSASSSGATSNAAAAATSTAASAARITAHEAAAYALGRAAGGDKQAAAASRGVRSSLNKPVRSTLSPARTASGEASVPLPHADEYAVELAEGVQGSSASQPLLKVRLPLHASTPGYDSPRTSSPGSDAAAAQRSPAAAAASGGGIIGGLVRRTGSVTAMGQQARPASGGGVRSSTGTAAGSPAATAAPGSPARSSSRQATGTAAGGAAPAFGSSSASRMRAGSAVGRSAAGAAAAAGQSSTPRPGEAAAAPPSGEQAAEDAPRRTSSPQAQGAKVGHSGGSFPLRSHNSASQPPGSGAGSPVRQDAPQQLVVPHAPPSPRQLRRQPSPRRAPSPGRDLRDLGSPSQQQQLGSPVLGSPQGMQRRELHSPSFGSPSGRGTSEGGHFHRASSLLHQEGLLLASTSHRMSQEGNQEG